MKKILFFLGLICNCSYVFTASQIALLYDQLVSKVSDQRSLLKGYSGQEVSEDKKRELLFDLDQVQENAAVAYDDWKKFGDYGSPEEIKNQTLQAGRIAAGGGVVARISFSQKLQEWSTIVDRIGRQFNFIVNLNRERKTDIAERVQKSAEQEKLFALTEQLAADLVKCKAAFVNAHVEGDKLVAYIRSSKLYDSKEVDRIVVAYQAALEAGATAYKKNKLGAGASEPFNLLPEIVRAFGLFCIQLLQVQVRIAQQDQSKYLQKMAVIAGRALGDTQSVSVFEREGYLKTFERFCKTYLPNVQKELIKQFNGQLIKATHVPFKALLFQITSIQELDGADVIAARLVYDFLTDQGGRLDAREAQDLNKKISAALALIYVHAANYLLTKKMVVGQNNILFRGEVIANFDQAQKLFTIASDVGNASLYKTFYESLVRADTNLKMIQSQKAPVFGNLATQYQAVLTDLKAAGDTADAAFVINQLATVSSTDYQNQILALFNTFFSKNEASLSTLSKLITSGVPNQDVASYSAVFSDFRTLFGQVKLLYQASVDALQAASQNAIKPASDIVTRLEVAEDVLTLVTYADDYMQAMGQLSRYAYDKSIEALTVAQKAYDAARASAARVDDVFKRYVNSALLIPIDSAKLWRGDRDLDSYVKFTDAFTAYVYSFIAHNLISDAKTQLAYYGFAHQARQASPAMNEFIMSQLQKQGDDQARVQELFNTTKKNETAARALTKDAWKSLQGGELSTTPAAVAWQAILDQFWTVYAMNYPAGLDAFVAASTEFAQEILQQDVSVKGLFYGLRVLFGSLIAAQSGNRDTLVGDIAKKMNDVIRTLFGSAQTLIARLSSPTLAASAAQDVTDLSIWQDQIDRFIHDQNSLIVRYGGKNISIQPFITASKRTSGTEYAVSQFNKIITIPDINIVSVSVYSKLGDDYYSKKNYQKAVSFYNKAYKLARDIKQTETEQALQAKYSMAKTLYYASFYRDSIIPSTERVQIAGTAVPTLYFIDKYGLLVPDAVAKTFPPNLEQLTSDQKKLSEFDIRVAVQTYLYNRIVFNFPDIPLESIGTTINDASGASSDAQVEQILAKVGFSESQQKMLVRILKDAQDFNDDLTRRIASKKSNLVLEGLPPKNGIPQFRIWESNKPILLLPVTPPLYQGAPVAYNYLLRAQELFGSTPITIGTTQFVPGNKPDEVARITSELITIWLSAGYSFAQRIELLKNEKLFKSVVAAAAPASSDVDVLYQKLRSLYFASEGGETPYSLITCYNSPLALGIVAQDSSLGSALRNLLAQSYRQAGDDLSYFIIGDPLSQVYVDRLNDVANWYASAIESFGYDQNLYAVVAELYRKAGIQIRDTGNYFGAVPNFVIAGLFYDKITKKTESLIAAKNRIIFERVESQFNGASSAFGAYMLAKNEGVRVTEVDGSQSTVTFEALTNAYASDLSQGTEMLTPGQSQALEVIKKDMLNALVFYADTAATLGNSAAVSDEKQAARVTADADKLITDFMQNKKIGLKSISDIVALVKRADALNIIKTFFSQSLAAANANKANEIVYKKAAAMWADKIYFALGQLYMFDLLGGISADAWMNLTSEVKNRANAMKSDSALYVG